MFQLTGDEVRNLRSQNAISSSDGYGGRRYLPYASTEQGVAMLSGVLNSQRAIAVNILIKRYRHGQRPARENLVNPLDLKRTLVNFTRASA